MENAPSLIGRYCPERSRATDEPGGQECNDCGCIFIGAEWHSVCSVCNDAREHAQRQDQQRAEWREELRRDAFGECP